ncbi:metal ABC transporter permease [Flavimaricola marinus]|uniref:Manganese transport system membrane protein MntB n=1 Tax=Flavimaricola marinus TaxID=1819565 RepID=A0A238LJ14_9RHOB|nr:metal ABC transporter permease [Flavimaricola marinus]SMY09533.1 Manganese transport system membrane protein MntB [Flavimaricola marinus]
MTELWQALTLQAGYNASLVALGAGLLGLSAGAAGSFMVLRKRALVSDAMAHSTLPGVGIAFLIMVSFGGEGRNLAGLLIGSAVTATLGLYLVDWISRRTRLAEDAAIGAVLSVFFGFGVVLLTVIQTMSAGRQAGLESFLLGSTAGMLFSDAVTIAGGGAIALAVIWLLRRPMTLVAFDAGFAQASGVNVRQTDLAMMALVMGVTVIGLKFVGLILIVALLIIPAVTARFWTNRAEALLWIAAGVGGASGYIGAAVSASAPDLPTGPIIVLIAAAIFVFSMFFAPLRGVLYAVIRHQRFQERVHLRQGLLAMARSEPIHDKMTLRLLLRAGYIRADGVATKAGAAQAAKAARDERRWTTARQVHHDSAQTGRYDGLTPIESVFTPDEIALFDEHLAGAPRS